jgi:hypothetical protein
MTPPFHKHHAKKLGDRVKIPRHAADESRGYYYGTVIRGKFIFDIGQFVPGGTELIVEWDDPVPFLGKYSGTMVAIKETKRSPKQSLFARTHPEATPSCTTI